MTVLYSNSFESDTSNETPSGWLGNWKVQETGDGATTGSKCMACWGGSEWLSIAKYVGISARTSVEYRVKQKAIFDGAALLLQTLEHTDNGESVNYANSYRFLATPSSASSVGISLTRDIANTWDGAAVASNSRSWSVTAGDVINTKIVVDGTSVKAWIWNESNESEPASPLIDYTDTSQRAAGYFTVRLINGGNTTSTYFDDVVISDVSAGGASASFTITSDDATFSGGATVSPMTSFTVTAEDAAFAGGASIGTASALFSPTTDSSIFSGGAIGDTSTGAITTPALKNNTGTVLANQTGIVAYVYNPSTGVLVVKLTGQTTNGSGVMTITDASIVSGTQYRVVIVLGSGAEGMDKLTAS